MNTKWAPRWSKIPRTIRIGNTNEETYVKSCIYRVHDCIHQLWGLPIPNEYFTESDRYNFKRAGMCGEITVLTLTEFVFCDHLYRFYPELREMLSKRNAVTMRYSKELAGKTPLEIALRLDELLHKKLRPLWVRESVTTTAFCNDYVPMLEADRHFLDQHWNALKEARYIPEDAPNSRYSPYLSGLELTTWMINDFYHLQKTDYTIDRALQQFNRARRNKIILPDNWD